MNDQSYVLLPDIFFKKMTDKAALVSLPLTLKNRRNAKAKTYVDQWLPKKLAGVVFIKGNPKIVIKLWKYRQLEEEWKKGMDDHYKDNYALQMYSPKSFDSVLLFAAYDTLKDKSSKSYGELFNIIKKMLPEGVKFLDVVKSITKNKKEHTLFNYSYIVTFKNKQIAYINRKSNNSYWNVTINNNTKDIYEGTFEMFLYVLSGKLISELEELINIYNPMAFITNNKLGKQMDDIYDKIDMFIKYLNKIDPKKAKEYRNIVRKKIETAKKFIIKK